MNTIKKLPKELIDLIAAGEVVERPSSVIKELVENSIDAKSSKIVIKIEGAGSKLIQVQDNGIGISSNDLPLTIEQHATSKITAERDLETIYTLGFRGEALASIASVASKTIIVSKTEQEPAHSITKEGPNINQTQERETQHGTTISIFNLFQNIPARKKFLKGESTELKHIYDTFINTVLPYLNIHFELYNENKLVYKLTKTKNMTDRLFEIFGKQIASNVIENTVDGGNIKVTGFLGNSLIGKKNNKHQYVYINNRFIKSNLINKAVQNGYSGQLHKDLKPTYFLFLNINPSQVDVNVHPRKLEVKFTNEQEIFSLISKFTFKTLEINSKFPKGGEQSIPSVSSGSELQEQSFGREDFIAQLTESKSPNNTKRSSYARSTVNDSLNFTKEIYRPSSSVSQFLVTENSSYQQAESANINPFQIFNTYICYEDGADMVFVDQHAASEKINFEKLIKNVERIETKPLLVPEIIEIKNQAEKEVLLANKEDFEKLGFIFDDFGGKAIQVSEIPAISNINDFSNLIDDLLKDEDDLDIKYTSEVNSEYNISKTSYLRIATIACHGSIRAGQPLQKSEMLQLVADVKKLDSAAHCPHGRPIAWRMSKYNIEKNFNRDI